MVSDKVVELTNFMFEFHKKIIIWLREYIYTKNTGKYFGELQASPNFNYEEENYTFNNLFYILKRRRKLKLCFVSLKFETFADNNITKVVFFDSYYGIRIETASPEILLMTLKQEYLQKRKRGK